LPQATRAACTCARPAVSSGGFAITCSRYRIVAAARAASSPRFASARSASVIIRTRSENVVRGTHPSCRRAFDGSPRRRSTSAGRRYRGSSST